MLFSLALFCSWTKCMMSYKQLVEWRCRIHRKCFLMAAHCILSPAMFAIESFLPDCRFVWSDSGDSQYLWSSWNYLLVGPVPSKIGASIRCRSQMEEESFWGCRFVCISLMLILLFNITTLIIDVVNDVILINVIIIINVFYSYSYYFIFLASIIPILQAWSSAY